MQHFAVPTVVVFQPPQSKLAAAPPLDLLYIRVETSAKTDVQFHSVKNVHFKVMLVTAILFFTYLIYFYFTIPHPPPSRGCLSADFTVQFHISSHFESQSLLLFPRFSCWLGAT